MSKCREAYETLFAEPWMDDRERSNLWQAAWNARGKVDAEICNQRAMTHYGGNEYRENEAECCAEAIEQEDEQ